jgi:hydroxyacylglutathione hydrolase
MIGIKTFVCNAFQENTYLLFDQDTRQCKVFDPGMSTMNEKNEFDRFLLENRLKLEAIINTHCHVDHVLGCRYIKEKYNVPFMIHRSELPMLEKAQLYGDFFGLEVEPPPLPDGFIAEHETMQIGTSGLHTIYVPGHSEGSVAFYNAEESFIIVGDVLFRGSIGRTDLTGGDYEILINSIKANLLSLPPETIVYPGHGASTTIGHEAKTNPFLI